jgi:H+/Cl- antiporter ClcA
MAEFPIPEAATNPEFQSSRKGQFGVALEPEVVKICLFALGVGLVAGLVAQGLLELIYLFTNIFFYGHFSFAITNPAHNHLGLWEILIPPLGGLVVGIMIYFWEPTLKGHGIPEAMESVLFGHSRMRIRVAILKPLATAFAIGTGGPFGAEGPIIQTGAALGSLFGQAVGLTPYYRRVLLASGAAAGMAATFTAPLAGILVAIELLLFELRARSFIPVAMAAAVATGVRIHFAGWAPLFPTPAFKMTGMKELWLFAILGLLMGVVGWVMIRVLGWLEDVFDHLPLKQAAIWSPVIGALILGVLGYFYPQVLGTSYDTIRDMLNDRVTAGPPGGDFRGEVLGADHLAGVGHHGRRLCAVAGGGWRPGRGVRDGDAAPAAHSSERSCVLRAGGHGRSVRRNRAGAVHQHRVPVRAEPQSERAAAADRVRDGFGWIRAAVQPRFDHDHQAGESAD